MRYYDDKYGATYRLPNDWIESWIDCLPPESVDDIELSILRRIENKRTVILNIDEVSYICEPILSSNYEYHMGLIGLELSKQIETEEDRQELIYLIEETKEILDNMRVFDDSDYSDAFDRNFMEIEEAAKKQLAGGTLTEEEVEYYQPWIVIYIKRLVEHLEELKQLKTRTLQQLVQIKEETDMLIRTIKHADKMYPDWRQLDYYRELALDEIVSSRLG